MAVELFLNSTATGSRTIFWFYCHFLVAVEVAVEMAVEFQSGSRKTPHHDHPLLMQKIWFDSKSATSRTSTYWFHFEMDETFLDTGPDFPQNFGHIEILPLQINSNFQRMESRDWIDLWNIFWGWDLLIWKRFRNESVPFEETSPIYRWIRKGKVSFKTTKNYFARNRYFCQHWLK